MNHQTESFQAEGGDSIYQSVSSDSEAGREGERVAGTRAVDVLCFTKLFRCDEE